MPQLRQDALTGHWVILAPDRQGRPNEYPLRPPAGPEPVTCPFCPGREHLTRPEVLATGRPGGGRPDSPGWRIRVVPNMYPALEETGERHPDEAAGAAGVAATPAAAADPQAGLFRLLPGLGAHEVLVGAPDHQAHLADLPPEHLAELLQVLWSRATDLAVRHRGHHVLPFCNHGPEAGATLRHLHLQILAAPVVPTTVAAKADALRRHARAAGRCLACDLIAAELRDGRRLILQDERWVALAPWASRFPWEVVLWPLAHRAAPRSDDGQDARSLAGVLRACLRAQRRLHGEHSFNLVFVLGPPGPAAAGVPAQAGGFHWHLELTPRLTRLAGLETGTGFSINPVPPEAAAEQLRGRIS